MNRPTQGEFDAAGQRHRDQIIINDWMPMAQEGVFYDEEVGIHGGSGFYDLREQRANLYLPAGLRQDGRRIHGIPQVGTARTYEFPALAVDENDPGNQDNKMVSLEVLPAVAQPVGGATGVRTGRRIGDPVPVNPQPVVPPAPVVHHDDHHHNNNWGWLIPTGLLALLLCGMMSVAGWVIATAPQIINFGAQPNLVQVGQSSTASWNVINAQQVLLDGVPVEASGQHSVVPGTHTLTAIGGPFRLFRPSATTSVMVVGGGSPPPSNTPAPGNTPGPGPSVVPSVQPTPGPSVGGSDAAWRAEKCVWLRANFPQTTDGVQALGASMAKVSPNRISAEKFVCNPESRESVFSGFVGLGPREGHSGEFTMTVPQFGVIDSYPVSCGAKYSEEPTLIGGHNPQVCDETWRAYRGSVTALRQTFWAFDDQNPPNRKVTPQGPAANPTPAAPAASASITNEQPYGVEELFKRNSIERTTGSGGQKVNEYGGLQGKATKQMDLPAKWEATCEKGLDIKENTGNRMIPAGTVCTFYPPFEWRGPLGYKG